MSAAVADDAKFRTALVPERQSLLGPLGCSFALHLGAGLGAWVFGALMGLVSFLPSCEGEPPDAMVVSIVALPKSRLNVPDRAQRAPVATGNVTSPEPPPVKQSDLVMPSPEPKPGNTSQDDANDRRADSERERLLQALLNAPEGPVDRDATDPNGIEGLENAVLGASAQGDPEVARWVSRVQQQMMQAFKPLASASGLKTSVLVTFDPATGVIQSWETTKPSGALAFDAAAERAVQEIGRLELPPEKYRELFAREGVEFEFTPPNR